MATDNLLTKGHTAFPNQVLLRDGTPDETVLTGNIALTRKSSQILALDPGGTLRTVTMPTATRDLRGLMFLIGNTADADESLVLYNGLSIIGTVGQDEATVAWCDGVQWIALAAWANAATFNPGANGLLLTISSTGTGATALRFGATITEGLELRVYEETVSPSAVETNLLNTPAGAVLLSVQANVETALTGGGTTVTWAIGIAADPDKYGYPGSDTLAQNGKVDTIPAHAVLAASEQMLLTGTATGGTADGDTALTVGSVRVRVTYWALNSLDNA